MACPKVTVWKPQDTNEVTHMFFKDKLELMGFLISCFIITLSYKLLNLSDISRQHIYIIVLVVMAIKKVYLFCNHITQYFRAFLIPSHLSKEVG